MMVKCVKLPVIQACTGFDGVLPGDLRGKNRVNSRIKNSIFTIAEIVNLTGELPKNEIHNHARLWG